MYKQPVGGLIPCEIRKYSEQSKSAKTEEKVQVKSFERLQHLAHRNYLESDLLLISIVRSARRSGECRVSGFER